MFEGLNCIELSGKKYPIKCDLLVLEKVQNAYGSIREFEEGLITWETKIDSEGNEAKDEKGKIMLRGKFPNVKVVNDALVWMVSEGEAITSEFEKRDTKEISRSELVRAVDIPLIELANKLHDEFYRCFNLKNAVATQIQTSENPQM